MKIPYSRDLIQECGGDLGTPQIRVWVHPHTGEDDYYEVFDSFQGAEEFIKAVPNAERAPLVAFRGYEIHLYAIRRGHA